MGVRRIRLLELRREGRGKERHAIRSVIRMTELGRGGGRGVDRVEVERHNDSVPIPVSRNGYTNKT